MYIENEIAYAGDKTPMIKVCGIRPMEGYKLWLRFNDGTTKIFVNTQSTCDIISADMKAFLNYLSKGNADSNLTQRIDEKILEAKRNAGWKGEFMTLYEHYQIEREEGRQEGLKEGSIKAVKALVSDFDIPLEEACKALGVSVQEYKDANIN